MFVSRIYIVGNDYRARAAARRLGLGRSSYSLRGEVVGYAYPCSDRTKRSRLKWTDGIGLMPGLGG